MDTGRNLAEIDGYMQVFAREAGHMALEIQRSGMGVSLKNGQVLNASNVVTLADKRIGAFAEDFFTRTFDGALVIQEETVDRFDVGRLNGQALTFVVDPIDGTLFYARKNFAWTISVGCFMGFTPVAGCVFAPALGDTYYTSEGGSYWNGQKIQALVPPEDLNGTILLRHIRAFYNLDSFPGYTLSIGSAALHLALTASGFACGCLVHNHRIYDVAGGITILENAGAELLYVDGSQPDWKDLLTHPARNAPKYFLACAQDHGAELRQYFKEKSD